MHLSTIAQGFLGLAAKLAIGVTLSNSIYATLLAVREMSFTITVRDMIFFLLSPERLGQSNRRFCTQAFPENGQHPVNIELMILLLH